MTGTVPSTHVAVQVAAPAEAVYAFVTDPTNLPRWAAGLAGATVELREGRWVTDSPMGEVEIAFAPRNEHGVADHDVTLPGGEVVSNPLRVLPNGDGCDVLFTVRQRPDMTPEDLARDVAAVRQDLERLAALLGAGGPAPTAPSQ
ncbi:MULTISPECIES: SRPBCC family protein [Pseudonocardia]|uniref:Polyketide cyclase / dehydrase and lipid transport n=1 Tax=Pseudonocardia oroxyli TaxID=366584 RepID=A0A1G7JMP8_PSEOR|nr:MULTISPECIES: SRPBCC family protein [Pseudonocardia]MCF7549889.1 SRPBCC family protein [Pseudonocardia sp. WMMC193]SDF26161.1 Polyketide cyclase / dehydrase and lipid transport [Pseudonocardia oroxyli]